MVFQCARMRRTQALPSSAPGNAGRTVAAGGPPGRLIWWLQYDDAVVGVGAYAAGEVGGAEVAAAGGKEGGGLPTAEARRHGAAVSAVLLVPAAVVEVGRYAAGEVGGG
ncbi:hypothetical protein GCM10028799_10650 [Kribbella italica]